MAGKRGKLEAAGDTVAIYHVVYKDERFELAAQTLFKLVQDAQTRCPGKKRKLFLDIEGHRSSTGEFDRDMVELQKEFLIGFLGRFLSEIHCPLLSVNNPRGQDDDIPPDLIVRDGYPGNGQS